MPSFETTSALKTKHSWLHESGDNYLDLLRRSGGKKPARHRRQAETSWTQKTQKTGTDHGFFSQVPDRVRELIRDKRYSLSTEQSCVQRISRLGDLVPASLQTPSTPHNASTARSPGLRCLSRWRTSWNWRSRLRKGVETGASQPGKNRGLSPVFLVLTAPYPIGHYASPSAGMLVTFSKTWQQALIPDTARRASFSETLRWPLCTMVCRRLIAN